MSRARNTEEIKRTLSRTKLFVSNVTLETSMTPISLKSGITALAFVFLAVPAFAQTPPPPAGGPADREAHREHWREAMQAHRAAEAKDLHTILNIHPDQEAAFAAFEASMTPPARDRRKGEGWKGDRAAEANLTTPQKLDRLQAKMTEHLARLQQHIAAVKTFYAALSPEQQRVFDALHRSHGGWGGHGRHGGEGHGPGEGPPPPPPGA